jgi:hypothetical protein
VVPNFTLLTTPPPAKEAPPSFVLDDPDAIPPVTSIPAKNPVSSANAEAGTNEAVIAAKNNSLEIIIAPRNFMRFFWALNKIRLTPPPPNKGLLKRFAAQFLANTFDRRSPAAASASVVRGYRCQASPPRWH